MISPLAFTSSTFDPIHKPQEIYEGSISNLVCLTSTLEEPYYATNAYKKVTNRIKPVATTLPENFHIVCHIPCNPLETLPKLPTQPPDFTPGSRYTLK